MIGKINFTEKFRGDIWRVVEKGTNCEKARRKLKTTLCEVSLFKLILI